MPGRAFKLVFDADNGYHLEHDPEGQKSAQAAIDELDAMAGAMVSARERRLNNEMLDVMENWPGVPADEKETGEVNVEAEARSILDYMEGYLSAFVIGYARSSIDFDIAYRELHGESLDFDLVTAMQANKERYVSTMSAFKNYRYNMDWLNGLQAAIKFRMQYFDESTGERIKRTAVKMQRHYKPAVLASVMDMPIKEVRKILKEHK
ncbi:hypothetical protein FACS1894184_19390 [Clostridia bacterium]|nr:hypothetical protein FACS1894184_19390 [Clostridia bacterium]